MPALVALGAVAAAVAMTAAFVGVGYRVRLLVRAPVEPGLRLPVDWLLGSLLVSAAVLALGLLRLWSPWTLGFVGFAGIAAFRVRGAGYRVAPLVPPALGALVSAPIALAPPFFYDALVYHLGLPWQALLEHGLHPHPEDLFSAFPPLAQLAYAPLLALGSDRGPALVHWVGFIVAGAAVVTLASSLRAPRWAAFAAGACLPLLPCQSLVPSLPAAESWLVAGTVVSTALVSRRTWRPGTAALAGLSLGVASAARLQGIPWAGILAVCVLLRRRDVREVLLYLGGWLSGSALWWGKNLFLLGDPTSPLLLRREGVETLWRDSGSLMHMTGGVLEVVRATAGALAPHAAYLGPMALAALLAVAYRGGRQHGWIAYATVAGVAAWALTGNLSRFLDAVAALVLVLVASAAGHSVPGRWAAGLALAVAAATGLLFSASQLGRWGGVGLAVESAAIVHERLVVTNPFPGFAAAGRLPPDARVLFVGEPRGFGFPRRFVAPSQHDVSPVRGILESARTPGDAAVALRASGFTHLLVNWGELARLAGGYPVAPWRDAAGWRRWDAFLKSLGPPVAQAGSVAIFALPGAGPGRV